MKKHNIGGNPMALQPKTIRIAVADSNQMASRLLSEALAKQPGFSVVSSDVTGESLLRSVLTLRPDIAVISAALPDGPFYRKSSAEEIRRRTPQCPWILLLDQSEPRLVVAAFRAGGHGGCFPASARRRRTPQCPWILLLDQSEPRLVVAAFRAGAKGVFSRAQADISLLAKCIRRVMRSEERPAGK